jgi:hypothetical protein
LKADSHLVIVPLKQNFNNELEFNEIQVISKMCHTNTASLKKKFSPKLERNEDPITPKRKLTNLVTSFTYLKLEMINPSPKKRCKQIVNGTK